MGIGEPFDNYDNVMDFIRIINSPYSLAIGARHITVSTCGIVPNMRRLAEEKGLSELPQEVYDMALAIPEEGLETLWWGFEKSKTTPIFTT